MRVVAVMSDQSFSGFLAELPQKILWGGLIGFAFSIGLLALFLVHQASLWISMDPETAFHGAKNLVWVYASVWDTTANIWNAFTEVLLVVIRGWNSGVEYMVQPLVFTALDVMSIAFTHRPYTGIISESSVPYEGFMCPPDGSRDKSSEWCGKLALYSDQLGVASGSQSNFVGNSTVLISTQTARRLSEIIGDPIVGALDLSVLANAIQALLGSLIVLVGSLSDVVFHVAWTVLSEVFETLFNLFILIAKSIASAAMMVVRSGVLSTLLQIGVDLIVVLFTDIIVPYYLALLNGVVCIIDLTQVAGWVTQLDCIDRVCFQQGSDVFGEVLHTFSSVPPIANAIQGIFIKLSNPNTGQRYASSSSGRIDTPEVDAGSTETPRTHVCAECFNCKVCFHILNPFSARAFYTFSQLWVCSVLPAASRTARSIPPRWYHLRMRTRWRKVLWPCRVRLPHGRSGIH